MNYSETLRQSIAVGIAALGVMMTSCSTKHNTALSRGYQRMTSHYNVYYNASEAFDGGVESIREAYVNDYSHVLPVYEFCNVTAASSGKGDMETVLKKSHKLVQLHSITVKPEASSNMTDEEKRFRAKEEFNPYVAEGYLLMGKANVVMHEEQEAQKYFDYLTMKHATERAAYEGRIWAAIAYTQLGQYNNAKTALKSYDMDGVAPVTLYGDYQAAYANIYITQGQYKEAIPYMEKAVENTKDRHARRRYTYILAQLYRENGEKEKAAPLFLKLSRGLQDPKMAFAAKLELGTVATTQEELVKAEKTLRKMSRDLSNEEEMDQIYYAIGNMELNKGNEAAAIEAYNTSVEKSVTNDNQKGLSFLALADIYQPRPQYIEASENLDSAAFYMSTDNDRKAEADKRSVLLQPLAEELRTIRDNDSLLRLATMDASSRNKILDQMVREDEERRRAAEEAREAEQENSMSQSDFYQMNNGASSSSGSKSSWYFYNSALVSAGKSTFRTRWGNRKNEDNWRRSDRSSVSSADTQGEEESGTDAAEAEVKQEMEEQAKQQNGPMTRESLTAGLPMTTQKQEENRQATAAALLKSAQILYDDLHDYATCVAQLDEYMRRYPNGEQKYDALTLLHFAQAKTGDASGQASTDIQIKSQFPGSEMAKNLNSPDYLAEVGSRHDKQENAYRATYAAYCGQDFGRAVTSATAALNDGATETQYRAPYLMVRAMAQAKQANTAEFRADLETIHAKYAGTPQDSLATLLLAELDKGRDPIRHTAYTSPLEQANAMQAGSATVEKAEYVYAPDSTHVIVCIVNNGALKEAQFCIADYNFRNYIIQDYDLQMKNLPGGKQAIIVSAFANKKEASTYFYAVREQKFWRDLTDTAIPQIYMMSVANYRLMSVGGMDEAFAQFMEENYKQ